MFLGFVVVIDAVGAMHLHYGNIIPALTYTSDYFPTPWITGHSWSLAVQEQFYLLCPVVIVILGRRRALWAAAAVVVASPIIRGAVFTLFMRHHPH